MTRLGNLVVLAVAGGTALGALAAEPDRITRRLRGYGETSATREGEEVRIDAASPEKAGLWAARYLHVNDKEKRVVKPGVVKLPDGTYNQVSVSGNRVVIRHSAGEPPSVLKTPLPAIPMYLNSWDDYCFRFYYRAGCSPAEFGLGPASWSGYDPESEFDFAKASGDAGFAFWCGDQVNEQAKGFTDAPEWAVRLAKERHLPIVLNTSFSAPHWFLDDNRGMNQEHAPGYVGSFHSVGEPLFASPFLSWGTSKGQNAALAPWQEFVRRLDCDEVIELLEPHGELNHGDYTVFNEYGPTADRSFRTYLREKYGSCEAVAKRWQDSAIGDWAAVRLPEIAEFAGWGPDAVDLRGDWRGRPLESENGGSYPVTTWQNEQAPYRPAPAEWTSSDADVTAWPLLYRDMPGSGIGYLYAKRPALIRRDFELPAQKGRTWLWLWDLSQARGSRVAVHVNGRLAGASRVQHAQCHWMSCEVTDFLKAGRNTLALELPHGVINYRVYLTHEEPKSYPYFGEGLNAKWVDFCGWQEWSRARAVEAGLRAHRAVEPDKSVVMMAPVAYFDTMRRLAMRYGGRFHDTGLMAACYWECLPMLMRSADMPFSVEPGGPAKSAEEFRWHFNLYLREGVNAVHYFIHVGNIFWHEGIRKEFERILPAIKMMGRMSPAERDVAMLMDSSISALMGYPWRHDPSVSYGSGYGLWRMNETLKDRLQVDAVTPADLISGAASKYPYIVDCNNTVMTPELAAAIEKYVRAGGTYVAMFQSGRHMPEKPDQWLLAPLTGCRSSVMTPYVKRRNASGEESVEPERLMKIRRTADERLGTTTELPLLGEFWGDGYRLEPQAEDVEVLYRWCDGEKEEPKSPAIVMRRVGAGRVISFGVRGRYYDAEARVLEQLLVTLGARQMPLVAPRNVQPRHFVTTDGLQDVWLLANEQNNNGADYEFRFRDGAERRLTDVLTGKPVALKGTLEPGGFVLATSPRAASDQAASAWHWVRNQFGWWRGGEQVPPAKPRAFGHKDVIDLGGSPWKVTFGGGGVAELPLGAWLVGRDIPADETSYVCEREVTVPEDWTDGDIELWAVGQYAFSWKGCDFDITVDGTEVQSGGGGVTGRVLRLAPGAKARFRISVRGDGHPRVRGFGGVTFLYFRPRPAGSFDLAGRWEVLSSAADPAPRAVDLPGKYTDGLTLRRTFDLPDVKARRFDVDFTSCGDSLLGVVINGRYLRRHHHRHGDRTVLNVTPWVRPGGKNEIWLIGNEFDYRPRSGDVREVKITWR